jgi:pilus assembly protein Flp/PilA
VDSPLFYEQSELAASGGNRQRCSLQSHRQASFLCHALLSAWINFNKNFHIGLYIKSPDRVGEHNSRVHVECSGGSQMNKLVLRFLRDNSGATAIEYGLDAAGISVAIIAAVQLTGTNVKNTFNSVANALQ